MVKMYHLYQFKAIVPLVNILSVCHFGLLLLYGWTDEWYNEK